MKESLKKCMQWREKKEKMRQKGKMQETVDLNYAQGKPERVGVPPGISARSQTIVVAVIAGCFLGVFVGG